MSSFSSLIGKPIGNLSLIGKWHRDVNIFTAIEGRMSDRCWMISTNVTNRPRCHAQLQFESPNLRHRLYSEQPRDSFDGVDSNLLVTDVKRFVGMQGTLRNRDDKSDSLRDWVLLWLANGQGISIESYREKCRALVVVEVDANAADLYKLAQTRLKTGDIPSYRFGESTP